MNFTELLFEINKSGIKISADNGALNISSPKGSLTQELRDSLTIHKEKLLNLISENNVNGNNATLPIIQPDLINLHKPFPLTDIQTAYWIGRQQVFSLGNVSTQVYFEFEKSDWDVDRLTTALNKLIDQHDMLKAVILQSGEQKILEEVPPYEIDVMDLRGQDPETVNDTLMKIRAERSHMVLPSDKWPIFMITATLYKRNTIRLHINLDMLIFDFSSIFLVLYEWFLYVVNPDITLEKAEISFRDYVLAEKSLEDSNLYKKSKEYWLNRIDNLPPGPDIPLKRNPNTITKSEFHRRNSKLDRETWNNLKEKAQKARITPSVILLACYAEVLSVWSKNSRFILNLTRSNRLPLHPQISKIIGDFTSISMIEIDKSINDSFIEFAVRIQKQLWKDLDHSYYSGVRLLGEMSSRENRSQANIFPVVFTSAIGLEALNEIDIDLNIFGEEIYSISQTPQIWLDHQVYEIKGELIFNWDAVEELFYEGMLDDMFHAYCKLIKGLSISDEIWKQTNIDLLPESQKKQRKALNSITSPISSEMMHTLFIQQVEKKPDKPAVITSFRTLTYDQLYKRAAQIGEKLCMNGAKPNALVGVVMEKGWEQIVAVMGILISGAAYLPIDAKFPKERIYNLIEAGRVNLVLTQSKYLEELKWPEKVKCFCVDNYDVDDFSCSLFEAIQKPTDLAYVIFTSGSTGKPKGVMIDHQGAVNTILDINQRLNIDDNDCVLALSNLTFDLSVYDIFGLLAGGGTIVIPDSDKRKDPRHWLKLMNAYNVTIWNTVPTLMKMLVEYVDNDSELIPDSFRLVMLSGDWIPLDLSDSIRSLVKDAKIISLGGATEASIWSILYPIEIIDKKWKSIPYGKPMVNQQFHVLNSSFKPCPVWVPGDLYIGGIGLAKGYFNDPEKTQTSFIKNPNTGERLYKTGDIGRYLPDGNIEFLGREDFQIKINGYRVELGEIENTLLQHNKIRKVAVKKITGKHGNETLSAYLVLNMIGNLKTEVSGSATDYEMEIKSDEEKNEILLDPVKRLAFKIQQPGILKIDGLSILLESGDIDIQTNYIKRSSSRRFLNRVIPAARFGNFLRCLRQMEFDGMPKYQYASAGGLYPVRVYIDIKPDRIDGIASGIYYYNSIEHSLIEINKNCGSHAGIHFKGNQNIFESAAFSIFLIGNLDAIIPMYGSKARDFCILEAGLITQLIELNGSLNGIGLCQIGGFSDESFIIEVLKLKEREILLHAIVGGLVDYNDTKRLFAISDNEFNKCNKDALLSEIQVYCSSKLPSYMVPSQWMILDDLPLSEVGKIDYKMLPDICDNYKKEVKSYVKPRNILEKTITEVMSELLNVNELDIYTNFFDLGADSLMIVKAFKKISKKIDLNFSVINMFEYPSVYELAHFMSELDDDKHTYDELEKKADNKKEVLRRRRAAIDKKEKNSRE